MAHEYEIRYERTMTVESCEPMTPAELVSFAAAVFFDKGALWYVRLGDNLYAIRWPEDER